MKPGANVIKIKLLFLIIVISISASYASDVKFYSVNSLYPVSMRETSSVCEDNKGFVWISSKTGILRLTGKDSRLYQLPYRTADIIFVKLTYKDPVLLAYTNNGQIFSYNELCDRFDLLLDARDHKARSCCGVVAEAQPDGERTRRIFERGIF